MGNKDKTVSFRLSESAFEKLSAIADKRDIKLSPIFRNYVDTFVAHDGKVRVVPEHQFDDEGEGEFPPEVTVPKSFVREHERLELEAEHLREQLDEHKRYITELKSRLEESDKEVIPLEDIDDADPVEDLDDRDPGEFDEVRLG